MEATSSIHSPLNQSPNFYESILRKKADKISVERDLLQCYLKDRREEREWSEDREKKVGPNLKGNCIEVFKSIMLPPYNVILWWR